MRDNPIHTFLQLMSGQLPDQLALGGYDWLTVALYWLLFIGGIAVAVVNWRRDPQQRTPRHVITFLLRFTLAGMWYLGTLWKLPWPDGGGFKYWMEQTVKFSSFQIHADLMQVFLNHLAIVQPLVYLLEIGFTVALMMGLLTRIASVVASLFIFNLLIGLYNDPTEWPWTYVGIVCAHAMFAIDNAGRSLGIDNLVAKRLLPIFDGESSATRLLRAVIT